MQGSRRLHSEMGIIQFTRIYTCVSSAARSPRLTGLCLAEVVILLIHVGVRERIRSCFIAPHRPIPPPPGTYDRYNIRPALRSCPLAGPHRYQESRADLGSSSNLPASPRGDPSYARAGSVCERGTLLEAKAFPYGPLSFCSLAASFVPWAPGEQDGLMTTWSL